MKKVEKGSDVEEYEPSPTKKDLKEVGPVAKGWEFNPDEILNSPRKVTGTFHVPKIDKDNELITKEAMSKAIPDFMHLPILHDYHKERVLGVVTKVWEEADAFHFDALFKATPDVNDAWEKVQKGQYDHVSIFGARMKGNPSCGLNPGQRSTPCISEAIRLDSISACDTGARNDHTSLSLAKAFYTDEFDIIKALSSESSLSHGIYDGPKGGKMKVHEADGEDVEEYEEEEVEKGDFSHHRGVREGLQQTREHPVGSHTGPRTSQKPGDTDFETRQNVRKGDDPDKPTPQELKERFKRQKEGTERSQGEDYHGGKLEKSLEEDMKDPENFRERSNKEIYREGQGPRNRNSAGEEVEKGIRPGSNRGMTMGHRNTLHPDDSPDWARQSFMGNGRGETARKKAEGGDLEKSRTPDERSKTNGVDDEEAEFAMRAQEKYGEEKKGGSCDKKDMLHKAKESLTGIYSMLKTILRHDKEMVEKDKEVHDKMEKGYKDDNLHEMGKQQRERREHAEKTFGTKQEPGRWEKYERKARFSKGGKRPKVTEEPVDPKKIGTSQPTNKNVEEKKAFSEGGKWVTGDNTSEGWRDERSKVYAGEKEPEVEKSAERDPPKQGRADAKERFDKRAGDKFVRAVKNLPRAEGFKQTSDFNKGDEEVEKGTLKDNRAGRGDMRDKSLFGPDPKFQQDVTRGSYRHESLQTHGRRSETPVKKGDEEVKAKDFGTRTQRTLAQNDEARLKSRFGIKERSEKIKKGEYMEDEFETEEVIEKAKMEEITDEQFVEEIVKAKLASNDEIVKAAVTAAVDEIRKAMETQIAELKAELDKIKEQPIVKAAILIPGEDGKVTGMPYNYDAIEAFTKRG